jgi:phosphatidyl-myo-inositol dimannoside synthase
MRFRSIYLWVPGISDTGGIQHYSWCMAQALRELFPETKLTILSRNDLTVDAAHLPGVRVVCCGAWTGKWGHIYYAVTNILRAWLRPGDLHLSTHPAFARTIRLASLFHGLSVTAAHGIEVWGAALQRIRSALKQVNAIFSVSEFTAKILVSEGGLSPEAVMVVPDTFKEQSFCPGPQSEVLLLRHGLLPDQPVLLTVGRLAASEAYKGQDQVIAALPEIRKQFPLTRYLIAGRGDDEPRLRALAKDLGQEDAVIFVGYVPQAELADYYRLADAFVMPSTGEGFGIVFLEAIASGKPCVAGNQDASPEALGDGRWGFSVNPRSPVEIASAVVKLLSRQHDKPWLHEPETLRREVIERYGFDAFKRSLAQALGKIGVQN